MTILDQIIKTSLELRERVEQRYREAVESDAAPSVDTPRMQVVLGMLGLTAEDLERDRQGFQKGEGHRPLRPFGSRTQTGDAP